MNLYRISTDKLESVEVLKEIKQGYITDHYVGYGSAQIVEKKDIGKYWFKTISEAKKHAEKEITDWALEYKKRLIKIQNIKEE